MSHNNRYDITKFARTESTFNIVVSTCCYDSSNLNKISIGYVKKEG